MRAVGFRRLEGTFDFARRFRFAYSLEHYNKLRASVLHPTKTTGDHDRARAGRLQG